MSRRLEQRRGGAVAAAPRRAFPLALAALAALSLAVLLLAGRALAQERPEMRDSTSTRSGAGVGLSGRDDLRDSSLSRSILRLGRIARRDPESALPGLEQLFAKHPEHHQLRLILARAYRDLRRHEESVALLDGLRREFPQASGYRDELIRTHLMAGDDAAAGALIDELIAASPRGAGAYEDAAALLQGVSRYDGVEEIYRRGLAALDPQDAAGRQRLLRRLLDHLALEDRYDELLRLLADEVQAQKEPSLRRRLITQGEKLVGEAANPRALLPLADSLAAAPVGPLLAIPLRLLYLGAGDYESFAECVLQAERGLGSHPGWLYEEGLRCLEGTGGDPAQRRAAAETIFAALLELKTSPDLEGRTRYQLVRIRLEVDEARRLAGDRPALVEARELQALLASLRERNPESAWATQALRAELRYLRERMRLPEEADALLRDWLLQPRRASDPESTWSLELELGENLLALGRWEEARDHFRYLALTTRSPLLITWVRYRSAQLIVLEGEDTTAAQDSLSTLAKDDPGGVLANDALDLALLLAESAAWPGSVRGFLNESLQLELTGRPAEAARAIATFAGEFPEDPAVPALRYREGHLRALAYEGREAVAAWEALADAHPGDFRAPQALERASRLALRMGDRTLARALLARLLDEHPDFPLRPGLRDLMESLEEDA